MQGQNVSETLNAMIARDPFFTLWGGAQFVVGLWLLYKLWQSVRGLRYERHAMIYQELDPDTHPVPAAVAPLAEQITGWGMRLIGVIHAKRIGMGEGMSWYYLNADGTIYVELVNLLGGMVGFSTWFPDHAYAMTSYPFGEQVTMPNLHIRFARQNLEVAYNYQRQFVAGWQSVHGQPISFKTMADFTPYRDIYREQYRAQVEARLTRLKITQTLTLSALTFVTLFSALIYTQMLPFDFASIWYHLLTVSWFALAGLLFFLQGRAKLSKGAIDAQIATPEFQF